MTELRDHQSPDAGESDSGGGVVVDGGAYGRGRAAKAKHVDIFVPGRLSSQPLPPPPPPPLSPQFSASSPSTLGSLNKSMLNRHQNSNSNSNNGQSGDRSPQMSASRGSGVTTPTASLSDGSNASFSMRDISFAARQLRESTSPHPSPLASRRKGGESPEPGFVTDCAPSRRLLQRGNSDSSATIPPSPASSPPIIVNRRSPSPQRAMPPRHENSEHAANDTRAGIPPVPPFGFSPPSRSKAGSPRFQAKRRANSIGSSTISSNDLSIPPAPPLDMASPPQRSPRQTPPRPTRRRPSDEALMRASAPPHVPDSPSRHKRSMSPATMPGAEHVPAVAPPSPSSARRMMMHRSMSMAEVKDSICSRSRSRSPGAVYETDDADDSVLMRRRMERSRRISLRENFETEDGATVLTDNNDTSTSSGSSVTSGYTTISSLTSPSCFTPSGRRLRICDVSLDGQETSPLPPLAPSSSNSPRHSSGNQQGRQSPARGRRRPTLQRHHVYHADDSNHPPPSPNQRPTLSQESGRRNLMDNRARIDEKLAQMERDEEAREERRRKALETARLRVISSGLEVVQRGTEPSDMLFPPKDMNPPARASSTVATTAIEGEDGDNEENNEEDANTNADTGNGTMAVATVITAEAVVAEHEMVTKNLPKAVEYDPDSKPPIYKNRRFRLYGSLGCALFLVVVSMSSWLIVSDSRSKKSELDEPKGPTEAPLSARDQLYRDLFANEIGEQVFESGTPQALAADWIVNKDPLALPVDSKFLLQRYIMAFFYFHFSDNGAKPWRSCNPPKEGETDECDYEYPFGGYPIEYRAVPGYTRWLSGKNECEWVGVICTDGPSPTVVGITLTGHMLSGSLPTEINALSFLQLINFSHNEITGTIPAEYGENRHLVSIELHYNVLTGKIPEEIYLRKGGPLIAFNVGSNLLSGSISTLIGTLRNHKYFFAFENNLTGAIPSEIGKLSVLERTYLRGNQFSGSIPTEIFASRMLSEISLDDNYLTGSLPTEVGQATRLSTLGFDSNKISGTIPTEIYGLSKLTVLRAYKNLLSGTISTRVGELSSLVGLVLANNPLTGTIPTELGSLEMLQFGFLELSQVSGSMPSEVCDLQGIEKLQADCAPVENPTIPCPCCTRCCDRSTQLCL